jgi:hypothetical protein
MTRGMFAGSLFVFAISCLLYSQTALQSVGDGDAALYMRMSHNMNLGIRLYEHPFYILTNRLFLLHRGDGIDWVARRMNLASSIYGSLSIALLFIATLSVTGNAAASLAGALAFAFSHTFWWVATTAEVYTFQMLFTLLILVLFFDFLSRKRLASSFAAFYLLGLGVSVHGQLVLLLVPSIFFYLYAVDILHRSKGSRRIVRLLMPCGAFMLGLSFYLILILHTLFSEPDADIFMRLTGDYFRGAIFSIKSVHGFFRSTTEFLISFLLQFNPVYIAAGIWAIIPRIRAEKDILRYYIIALSVVNILFVLNYPVMDQIFFHLPAYALFSLVIAKGIADWQKKVFSKHRTYATAARISVSLLIVVPLVTRPWEYLLMNNIVHRRLEILEKIGLAPVIPEVRGRDDLAYFIIPDKSDLSFSHVYLERLTHLPDGSVVIDDWIHGYPLMKEYYQNVMKVRPDVTIERWLYFLGSESEKEALVDRVAAMLGKRRIFVTTAGFPIDDFLERLEKKTPIVLHRQDEMIELLPANG